MTALRGPRSILHVLVGLGATNGQYNEHCLPLRHQRAITICSLRPPEVVPPPEIRLFTGDGTPRGSYRVLDRAFTDRDYDVVHAHAPVSGFLLMLVALRRRRSLRRCVFTLQNSYANYPRRNRALLFPIFALFPAVVLCSEAVRDSLPWLLRRVGGRRVTVVPNAVDLEHVQRALSDAEQEDGPAADGDGFRVVSVGRLIPIKNTFTMLEAFRRSANGHGPGRLVVVGDGDLRPALTAAAAEAGLSRRVTFTGMVSRDEVYRHVARGDAYISTSYGEGLPVAVLEAMSCGAPVVLSDIPPHREIARHDPGAVPLVPVDDTDGFARELARLRTMSPQQRAATGERCRAVVRTNYGTDAMHEALAHVYARVAGHPSMTGETR